MNLWFRYWQCLKKMWRIKWYFSIFFSIILLHVRKIGRSMASIEDFKWMSNKSKKAENLLNTTKWGFLRVKKSRRAVLFSIFTCFNNFNEIISSRKTFFLALEELFLKIFTCSDGHFQRIKWIFQRKVGINFVTFLQKHICFFRRHLEIGLTHKFRTSNRLHFAFIFEK